MSNTIALHNVTYVITNITRERYEVLAAGTRVGGFIRGPQAEVHLIAGTEEALTTIRHVAALFLAS